MLRPYNHTRDRGHRRENLDDCVRLDVRALAITYGILSTPCLYQSAWSDHPAQFKHAVQRH